MKEAPPPGAPSTSADVAPIDVIRVGERDRSDLGDIAELAASIAAVGLLHPIVITAENDLVAGGRRLAAIRSLGWTETPVTVVTNVDQVLLAVREESGYGLGYLSPLAASIVREQNTRALNRSGFLLAKNAETALYRFWAADGTLLYVGISFWPLTRWREHMRKAWWSDVARNLVEWLPTRAEAMRAEAKAIRDEGPLHNIVRPKVI